MGEGVLVNPVEGTVYAPCDATVKMIFPTKHAIGLETGDGIEVLIHMGIETVNLNGEGFTLFVKEGDSVKQGEKIAEMDLAKITEKGCKTQTMTVITKAEGRTVVTKPCENADSTTSVVTFAE